MEPALLRAQLLKGRESNVPCGQISFRIRRPSEMELVRMRQGDRFEVGLRCIQEFTVGWDGVRERDITPGGAEDMVAFDRDLYCAWIEDHPEFWPPLMDGFRKAIGDHEKYLESVSGNSSPSSTG